MIFRAVALSLLLFPALPARATPVEPPLPDFPSTRCSVCPGKGIVPCPHPWESLKTSAEPNVPKPNELDVGPLKVGGFFCSDCLDLACCRGLGWKPCEACAGDEVKTLWKERIHLRKDFLEFRHKVDAKLEIKPLHIRTQHYEMVFGLKPMLAEVWTDARERTYRDKFWFEEIERLQMNKRRVQPSRHFLAHLYARRLEECYEQFCERFDPDGSRPVATELAFQASGSAPLLLSGWPELDRRSKTELKAGTPIREWIFLLDGRPPGSMATIVSKYDEKSADMKSLYGVCGAMFYSFYATGRVRPFGPDADYHQYLYHNVAELLVHDFAISDKEYLGARTKRRSRIPYHDFPDWFHEAWARVQEMDRFGSAIVHCTAEDSHATFQSGDRARHVDNLKKWLGAKRLVPLPEIARFIRDNFDARIHTQIWYIVDYLRRRDPLAFPKLVARTKVLACELDDEKEGFIRALEEVHGLTPLGLDDAWRADLLR